MALVLLGQKCNLGIPELLEEVAQGTPPLPDRAHVPPADLIPLCPGRTCCLALAPVFPNQQAQPWSASFNERPRGVTLLLRVSDVSPTGSEGPSPGCGCVLKAPQPQEQ